MKSLIGPPFDAWRDTSDKVRMMMGDIGDHTCGVFLIPFRSSLLTVIASAAEGWDHVSVSLASRCPNWEEMEFVKRAFFRDDEWAMQLHAPPSRHINAMPSCLHIWRPMKAEIPQPPAWMVA